MSIFNLRGAIQEPSIGIYISIIEIVRTLSIAQTRILIIMENNTEIITKNIDLTTDGLTSSDELLESDYVDYYQLSNCESTIWEFNLADDLYKYLSLIILILGTLGNIISFVVFSTKSMSGSVSSIFFRALAIIDTIFLITALLRYWIIAVFDYDIRLYHAVACKLHKYLVYWSGHLTGLILSAVALERTIGVSMPHRYKSLVTRKRAKFLLATIILAIGVLDSYLFVSQKLLVSFNVFCMTDPKFTWFHDNIWFYMDITAYCFAPFTIICFSNVCIIYFVVRASIRRRKSMTTNQSSSNTSNLSTILITVSVVYLACTLPVELYIPLFKAWQVPGITCKTFAQLHLYNAFSTLLGTVNSAVNFLLYCLSGSSFRRALKGLLQSRADSLQ